MNTVCHMVDRSDVMTSPVECLNVSETVNCLRHIIDDPHSHNGYPVVEDYCPSSVRAVLLIFCLYFLLFFSACEIYL